MQFAIIGYGDYFDCHEQLQQYDYVIAADGGANHCQRMKVKPAVIIGDGDSITPNQSSKLQLQPDQNQSDLGKAIALAKTVAADKSYTIDLFSVTSSSRFDHSLAAVMQLLHSEIIRAIHTPSQVIRFCRDRFELADAVGTVISIIPTTSQATVSITGCQWSDENIRLDDTRSGLSNIVTKPAATITIQSGAILIITA